MSTTATNHHPIPVRIPTWIPEHSARRCGSHPDTDHRIRELVGYRLARLEAEVLAPVRGITSVDVRLRRIISSYVTLAITDPGIMTLVSGEQQVRGDAAPSPAVSDGIDRFVDCLQQALAEVIGRQARGIDPDVAVQSLLGIIHWGVSSHRAEERLSRDEAAAQITFLALHGLVSQPPQRAQPRPRPKVVKPAA